MTAFLRAFSRNKPAVAGFVVLLIIVFGAIFGPSLFDHGPWEMVARPMIPPFTDSSFILGTDGLGRDIAAGLVNGARVSLIVGLAAMLLSTIIGVLIGAFAGWYGGWVDDLLGRITETFQTMPFLLFSLAFVAILSPSIWTIVLSLGVVTWPPVARLVRGEMMSLRSREFVQAAVGIGMSNTRIIFAQMLPNCATSIIVMASVKVATAILAESSLSFLGLGDPNVISWGTMIAQARDLIRTAPYLTLVPGCAILFAVMAFSLIGDGLNDALNPRLRPR
jgi:peptide/nickel transport system permease protein